MIVNNRRCDPEHATVKYRFCSPDIERLAVSFRPYYLLREFTIVVAVYISLSVGAHAACDVISSAVAKLQTQQPSALLAVTGGFNHFSFSPPHFQHFNRLSAAPLERVKRWICFMQTSEMHKAPLCDLLDLVFLSSNCKPIIQRQPVTKRTVRRWSRKAEETLGCF